MKNTSEPTEKCVGNKTYNFMPAEYEIVTETQPLFKMLICAKILIYNRAVV